MKITRFDLFNSEVGTHDFAKIQLNICITNLRGPNIQFGQSLDPWGSCHDQLDALVPLSWNPDYLAVDQVPIVIDERLWIRPGLVTKKIYFRLLFHECDGVPGNRSKERKEALPKTLQDEKTLAFCPKTRYFADQLIF